MQDFSKTIATPTQKPEPVRAIVAEKDKFVTPLKTTVMTTPKEDFDMLDDLLAPTPASKPKTVAEPKKVASPMPKQVPVEVKPQGPSEALLKLQQLLSKNLENANNLKLPSHYERLLALFERVDFDVNFMHCRKGMWSSNLNSINDTVSKSLGRPFKENHFRAMLTVAPDFFVHKWEVRHNQMELFIEFPKHLK